MIVALSEVFIIRRSLSRFLLAAPLLCSPLFAQQTPEQTIVEVPPEPSKYLLRWRPQAGEVRVFRLKAAQRIANPQNAAQKLSQNFELDYEMTSGRPEADGTFALKTKFRAVRFSREAPGIRQRFDSARPPKSPSEEVAAFAALAGASVTLRFNEQGKLVGTLGVEAFHERILDALKIKPASRPAIRRALQGDASSSQAFRNIGNTVASFPPQPLAIDATWPKIDALDTDAAHTLDGTATLKSVTGNIASIGLQSKVVPAGSTTPGDPVTGTQQGEYEVEVASGWTRTASLRQRLQIRSQGAAISVSSDLSLRTLGVRAPK